MPSTDSPPFAWGPYQRVWWGMIFAVLGSGLAAPVAGQSRNEIRKALEKTLVHSAPVGKAAVKPANTRPHRPFAKVVPATFAADKPAVYSQPVTPGVSTAEAGWNDGKAVLAKGLAARNEKEFGEAKRYFKRAADLGNTDAMNEMGYLYEAGHGVPTDYVHARIWYQKAADLGNAGAMLSLGGLYDNGLGVEQDYALACPWYQKAADSGNTIAMLNLGYYYEHGLGVEQDYVQARTWYRKAAELGDTDAKDRLARLTFIGK